MEIEKLIEILRGKCAVCKRSSCNGKYWQLSSCPTTCEAADALEHLQAENDRLKEEVQQMRWTPVEERLPEKENAQVLMTDGGGWYISSRNNMVRFLDCEGIFIPGKAGAGVKVTHWMPLPAAPKEENKDD